jgi:predicted transposase YbfD/YdcC
MDERKYSTLVDVFQDMVDPRMRRGRRYNWVFLLILIASAIVSGQQTAHAIAHWVMLHANELRERLQPPRASLPSESTLRRVLRWIDVKILEQRLACQAELLAVMAPKAGAITASTGEVLQGQAIDGKAVRGARTHGTPLHLLSLVQHGSGRVLAQTNVDQKHNEISIAPQLLAGRELGGTVTTMDALLTQRELAQQILDQHGHYLMVVKRNQGNLYDAIALLFDQPPWVVSNKAAEYQSHTTTEKGHGRLERRTLETSTTLCDYVDWPGVGQVMRRHYESVRVRTGEVSSEITYGITDLRATEVGAAQLEQLWRGHWTIENKVHRVRDVTMGEDANQTYTGPAPHVLAALRNAVLNLFRQHGWTNIADAFRHYGASVDRALALIGAAPE